MTTIGLVGSKTRVDPFELAAAVFAEEEERVVSAAVAVVIEQLEAFVFPQVEASLNAYPEAARREHLQVELERDVKVMESV